MQKRRIEIFRTGTHKPMKGEARAFSESDLDSIVEKNTGRQVPLVIGHPKMEDPAYGWASSFAREGEVLFAEVDDNIDPEFEQLVNAGRYKNVSIHLNKDNTIRHIGFLGAVPPAVKGLKPVQFADDLEGECFGELEEEVPPAPDPAPDPEPEPEPEPTKGDPTLTRIQELEKQVNDLLKEKEEKLAADKKAEFAQFADELVSQGRVKQDMKARIVEVMEQLHQDDSGAMKFSDSEPAGVTAFRELLKALPKMVEPGRIVGMQFAQQDTPPIGKPLVGKKLGQFIKNQMENNDEA